MPAATIDACCLIDLLASGHAAAILRAGGHEWHLPAAVQAEVQFVRQPDPSGASRFISVPADLTALVSAGLLLPCQPTGQSELDLYTRYAAMFRSDGESVCLAVAQSRGWSMTTDDRKAMRIGQQAGVEVISSPQLVKRWADSASPNQATLVQALRDIERLAQFRPNATMQDCRWWLDRTA